MKPKAFNYEDYKALEAKLLDTERLLEQRDRALKEITEERDKLRDGIKKIMQGE